MQAAVGNMPIMTQNEARRSYLGLGPIEGGDKLMAPTTMIEAGTTQAVEGEDQTPQLAKAITVAGRYAKATRIRTGGKSAHSGAYKMRHALTDAFKKALDQKTQYQSKSVTELSHFEYMEHWKRFDDRSQRALAELHKVFLGINKNRKRK